MRVLSRQHTKRAKGLIGSKGQRDYHQKGDWNYAGNLVSSDDGLQNDRRKGSFISRKTSKCLPDQLG